MKIIIFISFLLITVTVQAEIYRWTDKDGNVHFGDTPKYIDSEKLDYEDGMEPEGNSEQGEGTAPPPPTVKQIEELTRQLRESREKREEERRKRKADLERKRLNEACEEKRKQAAVLKQQINQVQERRARETHSVTTRSVDKKTYVMKNQYKELQQDITENCQ